MYQLNRKATAHPRLPRIPIERKDHQKDITQKSRQTELESKLNNLIPGNNTDVWYRQSVDVQFVLLVLFSAHCDDRPSFREQLYRPSPAQMNSFQLDSFVVVFTTYPQWKVRKEYETVIMQFPGKLIGTCCSCKFFGEYWGSVLSSSSSTRRRLEFRCLLGRP